MNHKADSEIYIKRYFHEIADVQKLVGEECLESILAATELIINTFRSARKVLLCGNGGSAADCQHMATELVSSLNKDIVRPGLAAIALTTDSSLLTAFSNDHGFDGVFERQISALGQSGDVLVGISTSGNSVNVIRAVESALEIGMSVITLTGTKGKLAELGTVNIKIPSTDTQHIQEAHLAVEHVICHLTETILFSYDTGGAEVDNDN